MSGHTGYISSLAVLNDGTLASASGDKTVKLWNTTSYTLIRTLSGHTSEIKCIVALPDGRLASGSYDKTLKIWNTTSGVAVLSLTQNTYYVTSLAVLKDGTLASGGAYTIIIYNYTTGVMLRSHWLNLGSSSTKR